MILRPLVSICFGLLAVTSTSWAEDGAAARKAGDESSPQELVQIAESLSPSVVVVEYTIQSDKGATPQVDRASYYRAMINDPFGGETSTINWSEFISEERPVEVAGYFLKPDLVVTRDLLVHSRFIKEIAVRKGDQRVRATVSAHGQDEGSLFLRTDGLISGARPLEFADGEKAPSCNAEYRLRNSRWCVEVWGSSARIRLGENGVSGNMFNSGQLCLARDGKLIGLSFNRQHDLERGWRGSPEQREMVSAEAMTRLLSDLETSTARSLPRVSIKFRSPRGSDSGYGRHRRYRLDGDESGSSMTEWHGSGLLLDDSTVVVMANLKPEVTARLEAIKVFDAEDQPVSARFDGSLADYGCLVARLERPMSGSLVQCDAALESLVDRLLLIAEVSVVGEVRTTYYGRGRMTGVGLGWRRHLAPLVDCTAGASNAREYYGDSSKNGIFLFDREGKIVAVPVARRLKVAIEQGGGFRSWTGDDSGLLPFGYLAEAIEQRGKHIDLENKPLDESDENRLAWLGVELQHMDPDLARLNKVVDQTGGGRTGALVTYVYPDSPAEKAGLVMGDILLRLHVQNQPRPIEVNAESSDFGSGIPDEFWQMIDQVPDEYFDEIPKPWGSAETALTRALTDIGFGTPFTAEYFREGKVAKSDFKVVEGPPNFESAKRFKSKSAGITVRDLTYEVRRYFQLQPQDSGVIVSKVEKGSKAGVAGIKPLEIILSVNDQPLNNVADLEKQLAPGGDLRLNVKRMTISRIVKVKLKKADASSQPSTRNGGA